MKLPERRISQYVKEIKRKTWYRQGGACCCFYTGIPYRCALHYYGGASYYRKENNYGYFNKEKERKVALKLLNSQRRNKKFIDNLIAKWRKFEILENKFLKRLDKIDFSKLSDREFIDLHSRFIKLRIKIWLIGILIESFDPWGNFFIEQELKKYSGVILSPRDLAILTKSAKRSYLQRERLEFLRLASDINKNKIDLRGIKNNKKWFQKILNHQKRWYYIHNSWSHVEVLPLEFIFKTMGRCLRNIKKSKDEYRDLINYKQQRELGIKKIMKQTRMPKKFLNIICFFSRLTAWRDERKELTQIINHYANRFLEELHRRTKIKINILRFIDPLELKKLPLTKKYIDELKQRENGCINVNYRNKFYWTTEKQAEKIRSTFDSTMISGDLKGASANIGKARGVVKIIIAKEDFMKMRKGNVLVTQMTRPEFLPVLHKASAIVTDEGGITCHAAIVSRELGIPCVIATQVATNVLKDGDRVEVDANKGVVKKIK